MPGEPLELILQRGDVQHRAGLAVTHSCELPDLEARLDRLLHPNEISYLHGLRVARRRTSYLLGRVAAKRAIGVIARAPAPQIDIGFGVFGQPVVRLAQADQPNVNISHCEGLGAAVAFPAEHPMSLDVERCTPTAADTVRPCCSAGELALAAASPVDEVTSLTLQWSAKESLSKVMKFGLTVPLDVLAIASIEATGSGWAAVRFNIFTQYKALACVCDDMVLALVLPERTQLVCEVDAVKSLLRPVAETQPLQDSA